MSMKKVAEKAGVSISTVSRVINGLNTVRPEVIRQVREAMAEVGYIPRTVRPGPKLKPKPQSADENVTGRIGLLLVGRTRELLASPFMALALAGVQETSQQSGHDLMVLEMKDGREPPQTLRKREIDGLVVTGPVISQQVLDALHPIPTVWLLGDRKPLEICDHVMVNDRGVGVLAAQYLIDCGCRDTTYIDTVPPRCDFEERRDSFAGAIKAAGRHVEILESRTDASEKDSWIPERMRADLEVLVDQICKRTSIPDGFFFPTDQHSAIFQSLMRSRGFKPEVDFRAVSCNADEPWLSAMYPRAATIDTRPFDLGQAAVRRLNSRICNPCEQFVSIAGCPTLVAPQLGCTTPESDEGEKE